MKNRRYCLLGLLGIGLWASGCNLAKPLPSDYFGGEFVCYDDTARFFDCATGRTSVSYTHLYRQPRALYSETDSFLHFQPVHFLHLLEQSGNFHLLKMGFRPSGFDPREIENIVDQLQQQVAVFANDKMCIRDRFITL